jgi:hypothetical protein
MHGPIHTSRRPIFMVRFRAAPGRDPIRSLKALLKTAGRHFGLRALEVRGELRAPSSSPTAHASTSAATEPEGNLQMATKSEIFQTKYLSAPDLKKPTVVEIEAVNVEQLKSREGITSTKPVLYFRGGKKAFVVNATNFDAIVDITGEVDSDNWPGHRIELHATMTSMGGRQVPCIRVRAPKAKPAPLPINDESEDPADGFDPFV